MTIKEVIKNSLRYYSWRLQNPKKSFHEYYVSTISHRINNDKTHPTLGTNIKDSKRYYETAKIEKEFLIEQGLLPEHIFVDYGCGSLRLGSVLIEYINKGNYIGLDVTNEFFELGKSLISYKLLENKKPILKEINDESLNELKHKVDYLMSSAVLYHIPPNE